MYIRISKLRDHSISLDQYRYYTSNSANYLYTDGIKENNIFYKTSLPHNMIFTISIPVTNKCKCYLENTTFTTGLVWDN